MVFAACGGDDPSEPAPTEAAEDTAAPEATETPAEDTTPGDTTPPDTEAPAEDPLGTPTPAEGEPVKIGLITEGGGETVSSQSELTETGAQIAVEFVNEYRNGLAGHPIDLIICANKASASGATDCANQMIEEDVAAVVWPFTGSRLPPHRP